MARHEKQDPARVVELDKESVTLKQPTRIGGAALEAGDSVDVYPFERRHMVAANLVEGGLEDIASEAEKGQGNLEILKKIEDREGRYYSMEELWEKGDATGDGSGEEAPDAEQQ
jgi:hypothetical protein